MITKQLLAAVVILLFACSCRKNQQPNVEPQTPTVSLFSGGAAGYTDGSIKSALFYDPQGMVTDAAGNIYVADCGNHLIRKITLEGIVSTYAGNGVRGYRDGAALSAEFTFPFKIAIDPAGNLYISENSLVIRKISTSGMVTSIGTGCFSIAPKGLAVDKKGDLFVADKFHNYILKITSTGSVTTFAGTGNVGTQNGPGFSATFNKPEDIVLDKADNLYVADAGNNLIRKITAAGFVSTYAGSGSIGATDGAALSATFNNPFALTFDNAHNLYVADRTNNKVREITSKGMVSTIAGNGSIGDANGDGSAASFELLQGIVVDAHGNLYLSEGGNNDIRKITIK
ncbi:MAG TPA: NHL repeat-containing protein [Mucilaginibacter sp.]|jgi:sugar lactone lactonase YvrE|nr:NHL repeat-containing protein [Mucilaginibacter sp.]